ncbi:unnamed protein product [Prunus armeniaca]
MNRFLRLNYCICEEERTYDVDGWLAAWKVSGFMSMEQIVLSCADGSGEDYKLLPSGPASLPDEQVPISHNDDNVYWKELLMIVYVWVAFLIVQIVKVPFAVSVTLFEAKFLCKGPGLLHPKERKSQTGSCIRFFRTTAVGPLFLNWEFLLRHILKLAPPLIGSIVGSSGAALGSVGGVGGGIIGFDPKSSTAISKYRTEELYAILLVMQPMLMLGINIGVAFNVMYSSKSFNKGHRNMEERDNDEEESRKAVGIRVQTWRFLRLNYCICQEERTNDVDGWLDAWKVSGFMSMERNLKTLQPALPKDLEQQKSAHLLH